MRLFTGIEIPEDVVDSLNSLLDGLRPIAQLKWTAPYNFHLTTKFIGEWPEDRLTELIDVLRPIGRRGPIPSVDVEGIGWFPNAHSPRILWTGINAGPDLATLAADTDAALARIGVPKETKKFAPHLTLGRVKDVVPLSPLRQAIAKLDSPHFGSFSVTCFHLFESKPGPSGSIYTKISEVPLVIE